MDANKNNVADLIWMGPGSNIQILNLSCEQELSTPYMILADIKTQDKGLDFESMLFSDAEIILKCGPTLQDERKFTGIITRFSQCRTRFGNLPKATSTFYTYQVEIRPLFWILTQNYRSKVYQKKNAKEIITEILDEHAIKAKWDTQGTIKMREYCVQYEESDFNFVSRLLEDDGICYYFDHSAKQVVFTDHANGHKTCEPTAEARYVEEVSSRIQQGKHEFISDFNYEETLTTGAFHLRHYNYETSQTDLTVHAYAADKPNFPGLEYYKQAQNYLTGSEGKNWVKLRKEQAQAVAKRGVGLASCRSFEVGHKFKMTDHYRAELNMEWLITHTRISIEQGRYECRYEVLPVKIPFRPEFHAQRPKVGGLQTAIVTGPPGSEVYLDDLGRCKIQFHWDREGSRNDRSSMWVRVSNNYAGKDYGIQWIPRVGHEVLVTFIDGNPDLPIVTGRVYNDFNTPPLSPGQKTQNIIKSIKDNHLMFDDKDGNELVDLRAEKDMNTLVIHNDTQSIGANRTISIGADHGESIGSNMTITVEKDLTEHVKKNYRETVDENFEIEVHKNMSTKVVGDQSLHVNKNQTTEILKNMTLKVTGNATSKVEGNIRITGSKKGTLNIKESLTMIVGKSKVVLKKDGSIQISGKTLNIKTSGKITMKGSKVAIN